MRGSGGGPPPAPLGQPLETKSCLARRGVGFKGGVGSRGRNWFVTPKTDWGCGPVLSLSAPGALTGEQTKALVTQLTLFNQILAELRDDIRDQV